MFYSLNNLQFFFTFCGYINVLKNIASPLFICVTQFISLRRMCIAQRLILEFFLLHLHKHFILPMWPFAHARSLVVNPSRKYTARTASSYVIKSCQSARLVKYLIQILLSRSFDGTCIDIEYVYILLVLKM